MSTPTADIEHRASQALLLSAAGIKKKQGASFDISDSKKVKMQRRASRFQTVQPADAPTNKTDKDKLEVREALDEQRVAEQIEKQGETAVETFNPRTTLFLFLMGVGAACASFLVDHSTSLLIKGISVGCGLSRVGYQGGCVSDRSL